jgi:hypothetical protein
VTSIHLDDAALSRFASTPSENSPESRSPLSSNDDGSMNSLGDESIIFYEEDQEARRAALMNRSCFSFFCACENLWLTFISLMLLIFVVAHYAEMIFLADFNHNY